jgi:hypothetical protein
LRSTNDVKTAIEPILEERNWQAAGRDRAMIRHAPVILTIEARFDQGLYDGFSKRARTSTASVHSAQGERLLAIPDSPLTIGRNSNGCRQIA